MPLGQACSEGESFENIRLFEIWEVGRQLFDGVTVPSLRRSCRRSRAYPGCMACRPCLWIHRYSVELLHVVMLAQRVPEVRLGEGALRLNRRSQARLSGVISVPSRDYPVFGNAVSSTSALRWEVI